MLDRLRDDDALDDSAREAILTAVVERFPRERLVDAVRPRLSDLSGDDAEAVLRIVEAFGDRELFDVLASQLAEQPQLPAERAWEALSLLHTAGLLEEEAHSELREWWDDLNEIIEGDSSLEALAAGLEDEADGPWIALQGLTAVEPEVRAEIIAGLADMPGGPGLVEFLRLLAFAHDPATRWAALDALEDRDPTELAVKNAWESIAHAHPDPAIAERARDRIGETAGTELAVVNPPIHIPIRSQVTAVDGEGRSTILLASLDGNRWTGAAFVCHVLEGIVDVVGQDGTGTIGLDEAFETLNDQSESDVVENAPELALRLLGGSLSLCGPHTSPALRYWIERTAGPWFRCARGGLFGDWDPSTLPFDEMRNRAIAVLSACPDWADTSEFTIDLAREIGLRETGAQPDPKRDAGAYRYLFEHRLASRIELYQRMLLWMAAFWRASGRDELGQSALGLAWQLSDPQHAVPSHPFFVEFTTMSLNAALQQP